EALCQGCEKRRLRAGSQDLQRVPVKRERHAARAARPGARHRLRDERLMAAMNGEELADGHDGGAAREDLSPGPSPTRGGEKCGVGGEWLVRRSELEAGAARVGVDGGEDADHAAVRNTFSGATTRLPSRSSTRPMAISSPASSSTR